LERETDQSLEYIKLKKVKLPLNTPRRDTRRGGIAPLVLNLGTKMELVASLTGLFKLHQENTRSVGIEVGC
jgi:hypothetical protein